MALKATEERSDKPCRHVCSSCDVISTVRDTTRSAPPESDFPTRTDELDGGYERSVLLVCSSVPSVRDDPNAPLEQITIQLSIQKNLSYWHIYRKSLLTHLRRVTKRFVMAIWRSFTRPSHLSEMTRTHH